MTLGEELNEIRRSLNSWRRTPEFWIIVFGNLFFITAILLGGLLRTVFVPTEAKEMILKTQVFRTFKILNVKIPCHLDGTKLYGYKFIISSEVVKPPALPKDYIEGIACWNFSRGRWEWAIAAPEFSVLNSNPLRRQ
ncbi:MAG TPA: hypothetical protein VI750_10395 [Pyrinomonadaceae bacterium]|nr:hypothetical protein [Pyrinomonadaceae bacterium]